MNRLPFTAARTLEFPKSSLGKSHSSFLPARGQPKRPINFPARRLRHYRCSHRALPARLCIPALGVAARRGRQRAGVAEDMSHVSVRDHIAALARGSAIVEGRRGCTGLEGPQAVSESIRRRRAVHGRGAAAEQHSRRADLHRRGRRGGTMVRVSRWKRPSGLPARYR